MIEVAEIADKLNALAPVMAPELLPHGHKSGSKWMFSGIPDTGHSASAWVNLSGPAIGHWVDAGNCAAGEERGDMLDLLALKLFGGDPKSALQEAKRRLGIDDRFTPTRVHESEADKAARLERARAVLARREAEAEREREGKARAARALWLGDGAVPIKGTPAEAYLWARGIAWGKGAKWPGSLRFRSDLPHKPSGERFPAMLAAGFNAAGAHRFTHRIWLARRDGQWGKIDHEFAKMALGAVWGNFVPINKGASRKPMSDMPEGEPIYVTEGIEDACVVRMLRPELRIISAVFLANIGALELPERARRIVIVADRDDHPKAQEALERAIAAQQARGHEVLMVMPPPPHKDINDWLRANPRIAEAAA